MPQAKRIETGIVAISGKAPLDDYVRRITPTEFFAGPTLVLGPDGRFLFGSAVEFPASDRNTPVDGQSDSLLSDDLLSGERVEYVMWGSPADASYFTILRVWGTPREMNCSK